MQGSWSLLLGLPVTEFVVLQLARLVVLTGPAADEILELHSKAHEWPVNWDLNGFTYILEPRSFLAPLLSTHSALLTLLLDLGSHFT